ncbi:MAG: helix-turn-helix domain-containing protein [Lachnospiraceae bacterium]|jgi:transcriptional regulator with XRE-family HTH domain|nr:helix-turn-helix domain-containing protein [Lachnospiraceae bacterium]
MIGERLKELRKKNGYTQVTLADNLGVSKGTVAMWETDKRKHNNQRTLTKPA